MLQGDQTRTLCQAKYMKLYFGCWPHDFIASDYYVSVRLIVFQWSNSFFQVVSFRLFLSGGFRCLTVTEDTIHSDRNNLLRNFTSCLLCFLYHVTWKVRFSCLNIGKASKSTI